jgi:hypothetical protein
MAAGVDLEGQREIVDLVDDDANLIARVEHIVVIELEAVDLGRVARARC